MRVLGSRNCYFPSHLDNKIRNNITKRLHFNCYTFLVFLALQTRSRNFFSVRNNLLQSYVCKTRMIVNYDNHLIMQHNLHIDNFVEAIIIYILCHLQRIQKIQSLGWVLRLVCREHQWVLWMFFGRKGCSHFKDNANGVVEWEELDIDNIVLEIKKHMWIIVYVFKEAETFPLWVQIDDPHE